MKRTLLPGFAALCGLFSVIHSACGQTAVPGWVKTSAPSQWWSSLAVSADGKQIVAGGLGGPVYISTNYGATWTATSLSASVPTVSHAIASSADGKILAVGSNGGGTFYIYVSTDSGATWTARNPIPGSTPLTGVAMSADGTKLVAVTQNPAGNAGAIYTSTDTGTNWTVPFNGHAWSDVACSADGTKMVAVIGGIIGSTVTGQCYNSTNSGTNWTINNNAFDILCTSVATSADATKQFFAETSSSGIPSQGQVQAATNSGAAWNNYSSASLMNWSCVAGSTNGNHLVAAANISGSQGAYYPGLISTSTNMGDTWQFAAAPNDYWHSVAISADGTRMYAASGLANFGSIYASVTPSNDSPSLVIAPYGTNNLVSWPWPSTGFLLQQNTNLASPNWLTVSNPVVVVNQATLPATNSQNFYRLFHP